MAPRCAVGPTSKTQLCMGHDKRAMFLISDAITAGGRPSFTTLQTFRSQLASQSSRISGAVAGWGAAEPGAEILLREPARTSSFQHPAAGHTAWSTTSSTGLFLFWDGSAAPQRTTVPLFPVATSARCLEHSLSAAEPQSRDQPNSRNRDRSQCCCRRFQTLEKRHRPSPDLVTQAINERVYKPFGLVAVLARHDGEEHLARRTGDGLIAGTA